MSRRRRMPPENCRTGFVPVSASPTCSSSSSARTPAARRSRWCSRAKSTRFCRAPRMSSTAGCCPISPIRRRTARGCRTTSMPATSTRPPSGRVSVVRIAHRRRLARPVRPEQGADRAARHLQVHAVQHHLLPIPLGESRHRDRTRPRLPPYAVRHSIRTTTYAVRRYSASGSRGMRESEDMATEFTGTGDPARSMALLWRAVPAASRRPGPEVVAGRRPDRPRPPSGWPTPRGWPRCPMRRVAAELGVGRHDPLQRTCPGKGELVDLMLDAVLGELYPDEQAVTSGAWRARLKTVARANWDFFLRHPWALHLSPPAGRRSGPDLMRKYELELRAVDGLGLSEVQMDLLVTPGQRVRARHRRRGAREGRRGAASPASPRTSGGRRPSPTSPRSSTPSGTRRPPGSARSPARSSRRLRPRAVLRVRSRAAARRDRRPDPQRLATWLSPMRSHGGVRKPPVPVVPALACSSP